MSNHHVEVYSTKFEAKKHRIPFKSRVRSALLCCKYSMQIFHKNKLQTENFSL